MPFRSGVGFVWQKFVQTRAPEARLAVLGSFRKFDVRFVRHWRADRLGSFRIFLAEFPDGLLSRDCCAADGPFCVLAPGRPIRGTLPVYRIERRGTLFGRRCFCFNYLGRKRFGDWQVRPGTISRVAAEIFGRTYLSGMGTSRRIVPEGRSRQVSRIPVSWPLWPASAQIAQFRPIFPSFALHWLVRGRRLIEAVDDHLLVRHFAPFEQEPLLP